ncbi:YchJ family protein [Leekyejoonella antrihumi]|uniref:UPF0225 protein FGL98_16130 n=1 Tax=Leekyejoonella antrihumi TaxID=1660198 RepID=A0A563DXM8_9MICO|nr:YchJ family metal-binding protein [Leekyejoonella antrihumi]TWP34879.1 hypothetical protein FGL98_16130 [Leekyejoonella antrihumi]
MIDARGCPCGSGQPYDGCCGPLHRGERQALTAESLMRSRYAAFAVRDGEYLWRTWHPRNRPPAVILDPDREWVALRITDVVDGTADDAAGIVEFTARFRQITDGATGEQHERSTFARRAGRWFYVDSL